MVTDVPHLSRQAGRCRLLRRAVRALARAFTENALVIIACSDPMIPARRPFAAELTALRPENAEVIDIHTPTSTTRTGARSIARALRDVMPSIDRLRVASAWLGRR